MDEIEKIHLKNRALINARNYLLNQTPSDMVAIGSVTESIIDLTERHLAAADAPKIPIVDTAEQRQLHRAIEALAKNVKKKAPASQILRYAEAIHRLSPWPPSSKALRLSPWIKPWPPASKVLSRGRVGATRPYPPKR